MLQLPQGVVPSSRLYMVPLLMRYLLFFFWIIFRDESMSGGHEVPQGSMTWQECQEDRLFYESAEGNGVTSECYIREVFR